MTIRGPIATLILAAGLFACAPQQQQVTAPEREVPLQQRNNLSLVQLRAQDLRPGMTRADVYSLLGAPAEYGDGSWVYRGGGESLVVQFEDDRYTGHDGNAAQPRRSGR